MAGCSFAGTDPFMNGCVRETEPHEISITFPGDRVYRFGAAVKLNGTESPCTGANGLSLAVGTIGFVPYFGTLGSLRDLRARFDLKMLFVDTNTPITFHEQGDNPNELDDFGALYDPAEFEFTTVDGRRFQFNAAGKVVKMTDRNGNSLTINADGIIHSSGKSAKFYRDGAGRITEIYDPNGLDSTGQPAGPAALQFQYDGAGNLAAVLRLVDASTSAARPYVTTWFYYEDALHPHHLTRIVDPRGATAIRNEYGEDGRLKSTTDADGRITTFLHDLNGRVETVVDRLGLTNTYAYDTKGNVLFHTNADGVVTAFGYDTTLNLKTAETNALGTAAQSWTTFSYDANGALNGTTTAVATNTVINNAFGQPQIITDARGVTTHHGYDSLTGVLLAVTNAFGRPEQAVTRFTYDALGNLTSQTDALGNVASNRYNEFGWLTNTAALSPQLSTLGQASFTYDVNGNRLTERQRWNSVNDAVVTTSIYDGQNRVVATVNALGQTNQTVYDLLGKVQYSIDALGRVTEHQYDSRGFLSKTIHPDGTFEQFAYDADGRRTSSVDRAGRGTSYEFDALGRLVRAVFADGATNGTAYDAAGQVSRSMDARGTITAFGYDAAGRRIVVTNAFGVASIEQTNGFAYDGNGNLRLTFDALGRGTTNILDALNRTVATQFADGTSNRLGFDVLGRRVAETNEAGIVTRFGYDALGRLAATTNAWNGADATWATFNYDELGNQTQQTDALGRTTLFASDALGRRVKRTLPGAQTEGFAYDSTGNLLRHTNFNGLVITNGYDAMNRLLRKATLAGLGLLTNVYSASGTLTQRVDEAGLHTWVYDLRDRVRTNTTPAGALYYAYDSAGNLTNLQSSTASGVSAGYQYDALNRLTNVVDNRLGLTSKNTGYGFDAVGNLAWLRYPNGVTNQWQYDRRNRLTNEVWKLNTATLGSFFYKLGQAGNRTNLNETVNGTSRTFGWSFDPLYRLTNETISTHGTLGYRYDLVGNRTNRTSSVTGITATNNWYDANDWLDADNITNNGSAWFDANGNTRTNGVATYLYDWANRLTNSPNVTNIVYDANGNRVKKVAGGTTTLYLVSAVNPSGYAQVVEELTVSGGATNLACAYVYGLDLISQRQPTVTTNFYGYDGLGSVRFLLNLAGGLAGTNTFDAWGNLIASTGTITNRYLFAGEQWDADLGLYYNRARYWSPNAGRFWTMDTFAGNTQDPLSLHKYLYAHADPVNNLDPSGHETLGGQTVTAGGISGLASQSLGVINALRARAYVNLARAVLNQDKIFFYLEAASAGAVGLGFLGGIVDDMAGKLLQNTEAISDDPFTRGRQIERVAGANLAGNFEAIDDIRPGGVATQIKSIGLESGMDLDRRLMNEVRDHARELGNVDRDLRGVSHDGKRVRIRRDEIQHKVLTVAIPENHAPVVSSRAFRQALANYRSAYSVYIQVVPVRGWRK